MIYSVLLYFEEMEIVFLREEFLVDLCFDDVVDQFDYQEEHENASNCSDFLEF